MNFNYNISPKQRRTQQLVAQFNADEELWLSLESKRRRRRKLHLRMSVKLKRQLDLLEFARARPPQDCIGFWQANTDGIRCDPRAHGAAGAQKTEDRISGQGTSSAIPKRVEPSFSCFRNSESMEVFLGTLTLTF